VTWADTLRLLPKTKRHNSTLTPRDGILPPASGRRVYHTSLFREPKKFNL
jgi:hypothetical protein